MSTIGRDRRSLSGATALKGIQTQQLQSLLLAAWVSEVGDTFTQLLP